MSHSLLSKILDTYSDEEFLKADGFDDAILGIEDKTIRLIYSVDLCLKILMRKNKWTIHEALEYFSYNVEDAYVGEKTPIWCYDNFW